MQVFYGCNPLLSSGSYLGYMLEHNDYPIFNIFIKDGNTSEIFKILSELKSFYQYKHIIYLHFYSEVLKVKNEWKCWYKI